MHFTKKTVSEKRLDLIKNLKLKKGKSNFVYNMKLIYKKLIKIKILDNKEMIYLDAWIDDCKYLDNKL